MGTSSDYDLMGDVWRFTDQSMFNEMRMRIVTLNVIELDFFVISQLFNFVFPGTALTRFVLLEYI